MSVFNVHRGSELFLGVANRAFFPPLLAANVLLVQVSFNRLCSIPDPLPSSPFLFTQNACPRPSVYRSPRSSLTTERTGSARTAIVRTIRSARSTRTPPTSSRPFYRSVSSSVYKMAIFNWPHSQRRPFSSDMLSVGTSNVDYQFGLREIIMCPFSTMFWHFTDFNNYSTNPKHNQVNQWWK